MKNMKANRASRVNVPKLVALLFAVGLLVTFSSLTALAQSTDYWTTTGNASTTEDEANPAKPTYTNQTAAINGGPPGVYLLRYNLAAVDGLFNTSNGFIKLRVRDNGSGAQVLITLKRSSIVAGGIESIASFDSDTLTANTGFQTAPNVLFTHTFDFTNYVYWLEVSLNRIDPSGLPGFAGAIIGN